ncbi:MAG: DIP1984 family protein [Solirubrobacteraceae bacterium]|jgi:chromosome segregation ATPase
MTLIVGEALNRRADLQKRIAQLQNRLSACVLAQEGEEPPESPDLLLAELDVLCDELEGLIANINRTNANARLATGETVTEGLARRDVIALRQNALRAAIKAAGGGSGGALGLTRYSRSEIRMVRQVKIGDLQQKLDALARKRRELDNRLQEHNWQATLME